MKRFFFAVMAAAVAVSAFAGLSKYRGWESSPQGYFMTKAERAEWDAVKTDSEAQAFVEKFVASRGGDAWAAEVGKRAEMADKYLTVGKMQGSKALRGKAVIIFGPPSDLTVNDASETQVSRDNATMASVMTGGEGSVDFSAKSGMKAGSSMSEGTPNVMGNDRSTTRATRRYEMSFLATPGGAVNVTFVADLSTGKDSAGKDAKSLDEAFERAAQASIKK